MAGASQHVEFIMIAILQPGTYTHAAVGVHQLGGCAQRSHRRCKFNGMGPHLQTISPEAVLAPLCSFYLCACDVAGAASVQQPRLDGYSIMDGGWRRKQKERERSAQTAQPASPCHQCASWGFCCPTAQMFTPQSSQRRPLDDTKEL